MRGLANITPSASQNRNFDLIKVTDRIDNPILNNEFTVDCASCHMSTSEKVVVVNRLTDTFFSTNTQTKFKAAFKKDFAADLFLFIEKFLVQTAIRPSDHVFRNGPFIPMVNEYQKSKKQSDDMYVTNQLSYYRYSPIISRRVANETSRALSQLVTTNLRPPAMPAQCQPLVFDACENVLSEAAPQLERYFRSDFEYCLQASKCKY